MQDLRDKARRGMLPVAAALLAFVVLSPPLANAAPGDGFVDACFAGGAAKPNCPVSAGITGAFPEVLSPDGRQLYFQCDCGGPTGLWRVSR